MAAADVGNSKSGDHLVFYFAEMPKKHEKIESWTITISNTAPFKFSATGVSYVNGFELKEPRHSRNSEFQTRPDDLTKTPNQTVEIPVLLTVCCTLGVADFEFFCRVAPEDAFNLVTGQLGHFGCKFQ